MRAIVKHSLPSQRLSRVGAAVGSLSLVGLVIFGCVTAGSQLDDPYIFARYADNVVRLRDFVWNPSGPRVEGFSSWGWLGVYVIATMLHLPAVGAAKGFGLVLLAVLLMHGGRRIWVAASECPCAAMAGLVALGSAVDLAYYAGSGMDHILWALYAWIYIDWVARAKDISPRHWYVAACALLVRPEGFLLLVIPVAVVASRRKWWSLSTGALAGLLVLVGLVGMRYFLFDRLLPNAAAAKHLGGPILLRVVDGLRYLAPGFALYLLVTVAIVGGSSTVCERPQADQARAIGSVAFIVVSCLLVLVGGGDDVSAFGFTRLITPLIVPLTFLLVLGFVDLAERPLGYLRVAATMAVLLVVRAEAAFELLKQGTSATNLTSVRALLTEWPSAFRAQTHLPLSDYLRAHTPMGNEVAVPWAGRVPFESGLPTIDLLGLNDPHIGTAPLVDRGVDVRYDADYVLNRRPAFICENVIVRGSLAAVAHESDAQLRQRGAFKLGQRQLLRSPELVRNYAVDSSAPTAGTCFRRVDLID